MGLPSNSGRDRFEAHLEEGSEIRMNIGMRQEDQFLHKTVPVIVSLMGDAYPELKSNITAIEQAIAQHKIFSWIH